MAQKVADGLTIELTAGSDIAQGEVVQAGASAAVAVAPIAAGSKGPGSIVGAYKVTSNGVTAAAGEAANFDFSAQECVPTGGTDIGIYRKAVAGGDTEAEVVINVNI